MNIIVTCGPSYEPIDQVRRITNFSTGRLGITLANAFTAAGHTVHCLKGEQATDPTPLRTKVIPFSTNDDLLQKLKLLSTQPIDAIFHAAALCDFKPVVQTAHKKIPTNQGPLTIQLEPTTKILPHLRALFPQAKIVGWKYELDGCQKDALRKAFNQIKTTHTNACILNGAAYGHGFGLCELFSGPVETSKVYVSSPITTTTETTIVDPPLNIAHIPDLESLCAYLLHWTTRP